MNRAMNSLLERVREELGEGAEPLGRGQLQNGQELPYGAPDSSMVYRVVSVTAKRATLSRVSGLGDVGAKLMGKGGKLVLQWDGTGYGKNKYKGAYQKQQGNPKVYARADGIY